MEPEYSKGNGESNSKGNPANLYNGCYMPTIGDRIKRRMADLGVKQPYVSKMSGISQPTLSLLISGRNKSTANIVELASVLECNPNWLRTGKGPIGTKPDKDHEPGPDVRSNVPVISWTTAGKWAEVQDPFPPGEAEEWVATTKKVGPSSFALRIIGDSMEPKIPDGSIVIIDPGIRPANGKIVLAKRTNDQSATLKQLWYDGATPMLRPLNPRYPALDMPPDTRIIGVAVKLESDL